MNVYISTISGDWGPPCLTAAWQLNPGALPHGLTASLCIRLALLLRESGWQIPGLHSRPARVSIAARRGPNNASLDPALFRRRLRETS